MDAFQARKLIPLPLPKTRMTKKKTIIITLTMIRNTQVQTKLSWKNLGKLVLGKEAMEAVVRQLEETMQLKN